jgi:diadenosine tetraphosphate (Ap4A) HIT family hydrolase
VIPKIHQKYISELPEEYAAALGVAVTRVSKALAKGMAIHAIDRWSVWLTSTIVLENPGLNVVGNQEYAQAVPHVGVRCPSTGGRNVLDFLHPKVHYHIIPAPSLAVQRDKSKDKKLNPPTEEEMHRIEWAGRMELDDDFAQEFTEKIRRELSVTAMSNL